VKLQQSKEEKRKKVRDIDDLTLFVHLFAEKKFNCSNFQKQKESSVESTNMILWSTQKVLKDLQAGKITPVQAITSIVLSRELPRNDHFAKLYTSTDTTTDMVFVLNQEEFRCHQIVFSQSDFLKSCMK